MKALTVGELKRALDGVADDIEVILTSDTGVDQGMGEIIVEEAREVKYGSVNYFSIYANDHEESEDE